MSLHSGKYYDRNPSLKAIAEDWEREQKGEAPVPKEGAGAGEQEVGPKKRGRKKKQPVEKEEKDGDKDADKDGDKDGEDGGSDGAKDEEDPEDNVSGCTRVRAMLTTAWPRLRRAHGSAALSRFSSGGWSRSELQSARPPRCATRSDDRRTLHDAVVVPDSAWCSRGPSSSRSSWARRHCTLAS